MALAFDAENSCHVASIQVVQEQVLAKDSQDAISLTAKAELYGKL